MAHMGPTWVLSAPEWPHVGPMNLAIRNVSFLLGLMAGYRFSPGKLHVSMYLTDPKYRGLGLGRKSWNAALEDMGPHYNLSVVACTGVDSMYTKLGFGIVGSQRDVFVGVPNRSTLSGKLPAGVLIEQYGKGCMDDLREYDYEVSSVDRFEVVKRYLTTCVESVIVARESDLVKGYAALEKRGEHYHLAPLYADGREVAKALMSRLLEDVPAHESIALDMPRGNKGASTLREEVGINKVLFGDLTTMFTHEMYASRDDKIYSTTSTGMLLV